MSEPARFRAQMRNEPWIVPGAITFLRQFTAEHPGCDVLEFGGGASTIWFLGQGCHVVSFEAKLVWRELILDAAANRDIVTEAQAARLDLREWQDDVPGRLGDWFPLDSFDVVLIDGPLRRECLVRSAPLVRPDGVLMLDNSGRRYVQRPYCADWNWTCCVAASPDKFNVVRAARGIQDAAWATCWWQRPGPLAEAIYFDVFSEHQR